MRRAHSETTRRPKGFMRQRSLKTLALILGLLSIPLEGWSQSKAMPLCGELRSPAWESHALDRALIFIASEHDIALTEFGVDLAEVQTQFVYLQQEARLYVDHLELQGHLVMDRCGMVHEDRLSFPALEG